jgi:hypothetical protein
MSKASEAALGDLHAAVAVALTDAITPRNDSEGNPVVPAAAILAAAITFLKNNSITADPETNEGLQEVSRQLAARRKDAKGALSDNLKAADRLAETLSKQFGGLVQ